MQYACLLVYTTNETNINDALLTLLNYYTEHIHPSEEKKCILLCFIVSTEYHSPMA